MEKRKFCKVGKWCSCSGPGCAAWCGQESGAHVLDLAVQHCAAKSTMTTILKNKETIKAANVVKKEKSLTNGSQRRRKSFLGVDK